MDSPFKFLDAYQKDDRERFFGRERETAQLYNAVFASNLTLLYGASGTGKTSLINCGLGNKFYDTDWLPLFIRRNDNVNDSLEQAVNQRMISDNNPDFSKKSIADKLQLLYLDYYKPIYLIFDQFEELYILGKPAEQHLFHQNIARLLRSDLQAKVLLVIREEWIAYLNEFEKIVPSLFDNRLRIERMNDPNVYRVISGSCRYANIEVQEPGKTIMQIIENLRDKHERVDLTNLQVYLDRLYRGYQENSPNDKPEKIIFNPDLVNQVGKIDNVLSQFLDEQIFRIEAELQSRGVKNAKGLPLEILFSLVTEDGTKQALPATNILDNLPKNRNIDQADLEYCLQEFQRIKLLRQVEG
ncbi:MAG: hypothetical protein DHS20C18_17210 [Saprospiraceae bacterium]|nr:MAG: hypothetical protein DHS20C18_17210 [Saprospiraceae bacterium]